MTLGEYIIKEIHNCNKENLKPILITVSLDAHHDLARDDIGYFNADVSKFFDIDIIIDCDLTNVFSITCKRSKQRKDF